MKKLTKGTKVGIGVVIAVALVIIISLVGYLATDSKDVGLGKLGGASSSQGANGSGQDAGEKGKGIKPPRKGLVSVSKFTKGDPKKSVSLKNFAKDGCSIRKFCKGQP